MDKPANAYIPQEYAHKLQAQARYVWMIVVAVVSLWLALIVLPPILAGSGYASAASPIYSFFGFLCHQIPERSFHIFGHQLAVCSRCFGVYCGLLFGLLIYPVWRSMDNIEPLPRVWLFLSLIPITVDWSLTIFGIWENTHLSRFVTGSILGFACACYILPAVIEIKRNYSIAALTRNNGER
jgi:uncharacterized membrane protein